jgi:hypothetical protein
MLPSPLVPLAREPFVPTLIKYEGFDAVLRMLSKAFSGVGGNAVKHRETVNQVRADLSLSSVSRYRDV